MAPTRFARKHSGAPGIDGVTVAAIAASGVEGFLRNSPPGHRASPRPYYALRKTQDSVCTTSLTRVSSSMKHNGVVAASAFLKFLPMSSALCLDGALPERRVRLRSRCARRLDQ